MIYDAANIGFKADHESRFFSGCDLLHTRQRSDEAHLVQDATLALQHIRAGVAGIEATGIGQRNGYEGALAAGEFGSRSTEMVFGHCVGTIDAVAHLDAVQVDLHDALLAPQEFDEAGEIHLEALAYPGAAGPEENVLGRLLRNGGGSVLALVGVLDVAHGGLLDGFEVKAVVLQEAGIL